MACTAKVGVHILVTRDTGVGADIKILQIAHSGTDAVRSGPVCPGVGAQPGSCRCVTVLAGNSLEDLYIRAQLLRWHGLKRRVAKGATLATCWIGNVQHLSDGGRTPRFQQRKRTLMMVVVRRPEGELILVIPRATVATAGGTTLRAKKLWRNAISVAGKNQARIYQTQNSGPQGGNLFPPDAPSPGMV